ncbi:TetR/AcrR family transcriptional regulator [Brevibacterium linens]|uniref:TetR/AcrR family transcriptional regulator n=1 Tax=Brevibacterium linens TaxID=1703 RepID=UPI003BF4C26D
MLDGNDRRVRRTRTLLHRALIDLIMAKGYGRVTVQDILDQADVGRSTFYNHYTGKDDLLVESGGDHLRAMIGSASASPGTTSYDDDPLSPTLLIFQLAEDNRPLYSALIGGRGSAKVVTLAKTMITELFTDRLRRGRPETHDLDVQMTATFLANGLLGVLTWWLDARPDIPAEEIHRRFIALTARRVRDSDSSAG